jgi:hypothetical protein
MGGDEIGMDWSAVGCVEIDGGSFTDMDESVVVVPLVTPSSEAPGS